MFEVGESGHDVNRGIHIYWDMGNCPHHVLGPENYLMGTQSISPFLQVKLGLVNFQWAVDTNQVK